MTNLVTPPVKSVETEGSPFEVPNVVQREFSDEMKMLDGHANVAKSHMVDTFGSTPHKMVSDKNVVFPSVAKKMARNAAFLGVMLMAPLFGLFGQLQDRPDFLEVACSANSALSEEMSQAGFHAKRINYLEGYDLSSSRGTRMLKQEISMHPPRFAWISLPCTRLTSLINLTQRTEDEWARFEKRQRQDLKRASEVADSCEPILANDGDLAWEWPAHATSGWKSFAVNRLLKLFKKYNRVPYWCRFDGCAYGLKFQDVPVRKGWMVLTSSRSLWLSLQKRCPGHADHCECRGKVAQASAYYPKAMVTAVVKAITGQWEQIEETQGIGLVADAEHYLLNIEKVPEYESGGTANRALRDETPGVFLP